MAKRRKRRRPESSSPTKRIKTKTKERETILCFQDVWKEHCSNNHGNDVRIDADAVSSVFFELANAPSVSYRLETPTTLGSTLPDSNNDEIENDEAKLSKDSIATDSKDPTANNTIVIQQDVSGAAETHTGGIVWETSYLLLNYLLSSKKWLVAPPSERATGRPRTILEIGAGCGMLGLALHKAFELGIIRDGEDSDRRNGAPSRVILTETNEVMDNLRKNLERNYPKDGEVAQNTGNNSIKDSNELSVEELDWTRCEEDCAKAEIKAGSVDCIVGTDVVFSTRFVRPMLETMRFLSHSHTTVYLCLQERCRDSHELLLGEAIHYGFRVEDISETVYNDAKLSHSCGFGRSLECKLLKFSIVSMKEGDRKQTKKAKKKKKEKKKSKE